MADDRASHIEKPGVTAELVIQAVTQNVYGHDSLDPLYATKAKILNDSLQEIGMGKYQVRLNPGCKVSCPVLRSSSSGIFLSSLALVGSRAYPSSSTAE